MHIRSRQKPSATHDGGWVPGGTVLGGTYVPWESRPILVNDAIGIIREYCNPERIIIYGPAANGYVEGNRVDILVVIRRGDIDQIRRGLTVELAMDDIDGNVTVVDERLFRRGAKLSYTETYDAIRTGYEVRWDGPKDNDRWKGRPSVPYFPLYTATTI